MTLTGRESGLPMGVRTSGQFCPVQEVLNENQ